MAGTRATAEVRATRVRNAAIVAASVALHLVVLGYLAVQSFRPSLARPDIATAPPIFLDIEPRHLLRGEQPRPPVERQVRETVARAAQGASAPAATPSAPSPPRPRTSDAAAPVPPVEVGTNPWTVRQDTEGDRIARNLRVTAGCTSPELLTAGERAVCDERLGERAARAAAIQGSGDAARDGRFAAQGARELARYEARRRPLGANRGDYRPNDCPGSNLGFNCAGAHLDRGFRQDREDDLDAALGRDRGDLSRPRLPHASERRD